MDFFFSHFLKAADIHARYIELLTRSGDYYRFLSEMLKSLEDLKVICFLGVLLSVFKERKKQHRTLLSLLHYNTGWPGCISSKLLTHFEPGLSAVLLCSWPK